LGQQKWTHVHLSISLGNHALDLEGQVLGLGLACYGLESKSGMWVRHEKHCTLHTLKVKRSKVKVTRSFDVVAQKHRIYPVNVTR